MRIIGLERSSALIPLSLYIAIGKNKIAAIANLRKTKSKGSIELFSNPHCITTKLVPHNKAAMETSKLPETGVLLSIVPNISMSLYINLCLII